MAESEKNPMTKMTGPAGPRSVAGAVHESPGTLPALKAFRSLKGDIADLVSSSEDSRKALAKLDKRLEKQVEDYAATGGDEKVSAAILSREAYSGDDDSVTADSLPFVIRKIREAHGDTDDTNLKREDIVNEIEKDYSKGGTTKTGGRNGEEIIDLGGLPTPTHAGTPGHRTVRTVQGITSSPNTDQIRSLDNESIYKESSYSEPANRQQQSPQQQYSNNNMPPIQVNVKINREDLIDSARQAQGNPADPIINIAVTPDGKVIRPEPKPEPKPAPKPEVKLEVKPEVKAAVPETPKPKAETPKAPAPEVHTVPQAKPVPKHELTFTPTPPVSVLEEQVKKPAEPKMEQRPEQKPAPKSEEKVAPIPTPAAKIEQKPAQPTPAATRPSFHIDIDTGPKTDDEIFDEKISEIETKLDEFDAALDQVRQEIESVTGQRDGLKTSLDPIITQEQNTESEESALDAKLEGTINPEEKRAIESKHWDLEQAREKTEKERWSIEQNITALDEKLKELAREQAKITREKKTFTDKLEDIKNKKAAVSAKVERVDVVKELEEVRAMEKSLESEWKALRSDYDKAERSLNLLLKQEDDVRSDIKSISAREKMALRPDERHKLEEEREKKEAARKQMGDSEVNTEEEAAKAEQLIADLQDKFQTIKSKEVVLATKVKNLDAIITKAGI